MRDKLTRHEGKFEGLILITHSTLVISYLQIDKNNFSQ